MNNSDRPAFKLRALAAAGLGALFFIVYNITNYLASQAPHRAGWHMQWELDVPIIPWLIVPYWSVDVLFVIGFLLCTTRSELAVLAQRVCASILIAGCIFWLYPMTLVFERTTDHGIWSPFFTALYSFDFPHNLFPSLHVTFALIMRWTYARHVRGITLILFHFWFALITISTFLVHQHHLIDVLGGGILGVLVMYMFDEQHIFSSGIIKNQRSQKLTIAYGSATLLLIAIALIMQGWYFLLCWPAFSLLAVTCAYAGIGPRICQPRAAGPSIPARILLFPWLECLGWSRRWWWRKPFPITHVDDKLSLGRIPDIKTWQGHVIDCTCEHRRRMPIDGTYERVPMLDLVLPDASTLKHCAQLIEEKLSSGKPVLIVCGLGLGRSALSACAWLLVSGRANSVEEAIERVKQARPEVTWASGANELLAQLNQH